MRYEVEVEPKVKGLEELSKIIERIERISSELKEVIHELENANVEIEINFGKISPAAPPVLIEERQESLEDTSDANDPMDDYIDSMIRSSTHGTSSERT